MFRLSVFATSDVHGNVGWDYYRNQPAPGGLARAATVIRNLRSECAMQGRSTVLVDCGDMIQGNPLVSLAARDIGGKHPIARAMNTMDYDAMCVGNHEFNYGIDALNAFIEQLYCPVLAANAVHLKSGLPAFRQLAFRVFYIGNNIPPIIVGILGLTNPGSTLWDSGHLQGRIRIDDMVATAQQLMDMGPSPDVTIVLCHGGDSGTSTYSVEGVPCENPAVQLAEQVPGIDAIVMGHVHKNVPQRIVTNVQTGHPVVLTEPGARGEYVSRIDLELELQDGRWVIVDRTATTIPTSDAPEDRRVLNAVSNQHAEAIRYVDQVVATSTQPLTMASARCEPAELVSLIHQVQTETVRAGLAGTRYAKLPVLSSVAPFSRSATFPQGPVCIRDIARLYPFENTLEAVVINGAELRAYLECAASYYRTVASGVIDADQLGTPDAPDYNLDTIAGVNYTIDIAQPAGSRIVELAPAGGRRVRDRDRFVLALPSYRRSGGGGYPGMPREPIYDRQQEIRQLVIDWVRRVGVVDPSVFHRSSWRLLAGNSPVDVCL